MTGLAQPHPGAQPQLSTHRGHAIHQEGPTAFAIYKNGHLVTRCGSAWGCVTYIDELLAP